MTKPLSLMLIMKALTRLRSLKNISKRAAFNVGLISKKK